MVVVFCWMVDCRRDHFHGLVVHNVEPTSVVLYMARSPRNLSEPRSVVTGEQLSFVKRKAYIVACLVVASRE